MRPPVGTAYAVWVGIGAVGTAAYGMLWLGEDRSVARMACFGLILVGIVPTAFALNRTPDAAKLDQFRVASVQMEAVLKTYTKPGVTVADPREAVKMAVREKTYTDATTVALSGMVTGMLKDVESYKTLTDVPTARVSNRRNDMYLIGEALKLIDKKQQLKVTDDELKAVVAYHKAVDDATRFIPLWVKVGVAIALGLGTMVGDRKSVVSGKSVQ
jgi:PiT family inorganic phosphate transporter